MSSLNLRKTAKHLVIIDIERNILFSMVYGNRHFALLRSFRTANSIVHELGEMIGKCVAMKFDFWNRKVPFRKNLPQGLKPGSF